MIIDSNAHALSGITAVITRAAEQADGALEPLTAKGAEVILLPAIAVSQIALSESIKTKLYNGYFDFILFSSQNAVKFFFQQVPAGLFGSGISATLGAVGGKTRESIEKLGIKVDFSPSEFSAEGFLAEYDDHNLAGKNILLPCSSIARDTLYQGLDRIGANPVRAVVYATEKPTATEYTQKIIRMMDKRPDVYIFASPSAVDNFIAMLDIQNPQDYFSDSVIAVIGPATRQTAENHKIKTIIQPKTATMENLIAEVIQYFTEKKEMQNE